MCVEEHEACIHMAGQTKKLRKMQNCRKMELVYHEINRYTNLIFSVNE